MRAALVSEYRKLVTTRLWWVLAIANFAYMAFLGAVLGLSLSQGDTAAMTAGMSTTALPARDVALSSYTLSASLGYVFPLVVGALAMTGEFRHHTITATLLGEPQRSVVLGAKLVVGFGAGVIHGVAGTLGAVAGAVPVLLILNRPLLLTDGGILAALGWAVLALALWAVIGVGLGTLLTNQTAAVVVVLAFTQFVEPILRVALASTDALAGVERFLPGAAAEALVGGSLYSTTGLAELLPRYGGLAVMLGYAVLFASVGRLTTLRRDIS